jgi:hypothetical protein
MNKDYDATQKEINAKNKAINKQLHVKGKKTSKRTRNKKK